MSYLERLGMKATGNAQDVRPRSRSRFEQVQARGDSAELEIEARPPSPSGDDVRPPNAPTRAEPTVRHEARTSTPPGAAHIPDPIAAAGTPAPAQEAGSIWAKREEDPFRVAPVPPPAVSAFDPPQPSMVPPPAWEERPRSQAPIPPSFEPSLAPGRSIRARDSGSAPFPARGQREGSLPRSDVESGVRHVHVTIGRVEVRAVAPEPAPRPLTPSRRPVALSLEEYLRKRGEP